jgi:hypothetical protein
VKEFKRMTEGNSFENHSFVPPLVSLSVGLLQPAGAVIRMGSGTLQLGGISIGK